MKKITDLLKSSEMQISERKSSMTSAGLAPFEKYGSLTNFLAKMNPDVQVYCKRNEEKSYMGDAPTLNAIDSAFGEGSGETWLKLQVYNLSEYSGTKDKISREQINEIAKVMRMKYGSLKSSELSLFFFEYKSGEYGEFYGAVDPMKIMSAMSRFIKHRNEKIAEYMLKEESRKAMEYMQAIKEGKTMNYQQWQEYKKLNNL